MTYPDCTRAYVPRWDPYILPSEDDMEFRLTYAGELLAHTDDKRLAERALHVHKMRRDFQKQLTAIWKKHPVLIAHAKSPSDMDSLFPTVVIEDFEFRPMVTSKNGIICKLDILMLRSGEPGRVLADIDNRLKTLFDALRMPKSKEELGSKSSRGQQRPGDDEKPFNVLLEDDRLITHVSVTSDTLLEPVDGVPEDNAARLVIGVTVRPYHTHLDNLSFV